MNPRIKTALHLLLLTIILYALAWLLMSTLTFFSSDNGLRFVQIQELIRQDGQTFAVSYPARYLDPELDYTPFYFAYSLVDGEIFLQISPFLPLITAGLYAALGTFGLPIIPVLGGVFTAAAIFSLGRLARVKRPYLLLWSAVFATPVAFYSLELWDHTLAVAFALWSLVGVAYSFQSKRWPYALLGGMALGLGLGQRPEIYAFALALGIGILMIGWRQWRIWSALIIGALLTALPVWFLQWQWTGHPLGMATAPHIFGYGLRDAYAYTNPPLPRIDILSIYMLYVQNQEPITFAAALTTICGMFLTIFSVRIPRWQKPWLLWLGFALLICGTALTIGYTFGATIPGFFTIFPLAAIALIFIDKAQDLSSGRIGYLLAFLAGLLFLGLMIAFWPTPGGAQWGTRYLLPAYPLFVFLAFYVMRIQNQILTGTFSKTFRRVAAGLFIATLIVQSYGIIILVDYHREETLTKEAVAELPAEVVLTNNPFFPSVMSATDKQFLYVNAPEDFQDLIPRLFAAGIDRFALLTLQERPISAPKQVNDIVVSPAGDFIYFLERAPATGEHHD